MNKKTKIKKQLPDSNQQSTIANRQFLHRRGFSLIELLIVLAVMSIMTAILFVKRNDSKATSDLENGARQVAAQLRSLQNEALNGKMIDTDNDGTGDTIACGMQFNTKPNTPLKYSYKIGYYDCGSPAALINGSEQEFLIGKSATNKSVLFSYRATLDPYINFSTPRASVKFGGGMAMVGAGVGVRMISGDGTKRALVCFYTNGSIVETKVVDASAAPTCP